MIAVRLSSFQNAGMLECFGHRPLGHLTVTAEHPGPIWQAVQCFAGNRNTYANRESLPQRAGAHIDKLKSRDRVALHPAAELTEAEHLLVRNRSGRLVQGV